GNPIPDANTPSYSNDPTDPMKVVPNETVPVVPGYTPSISTVTPADPTQDTPVTYTQNEYQLTEQFVDENGNELAPGKNGTYHYDDSFDVTGDAQVIDGYVLVKQENTSGTFGAGDETAKFVYKQVGKIIPVDEAGNPIPGANTPSYSNDPTDPMKVVPNETVPTVPGYTPSILTVTPADPTQDTPVTYTQNEYQLTEQFVDENGNELASNKNGTYHYGDLFDITGDAQVIDGYVLINQENTAGTFGDGDQTAKFIYKQVGKIIPVDEAGNPIPGANTPSYPNDPTDPTKVVQNETVPTVPGYTPSISTVTPADPTKDTPVTYTQNEYQLTEQFIDENGNELVPSKDSSYHYGDSFDVTGDAQVIDGYVLVKQENTAGTFGEGDQTAKFVYKQVGKIIPVDEAGNPIPGAATPSYSNDPTDPTKVVPNETVPTVPGYTPSTPSMTPEDPTKDTPVTYTQNEYQLTEQFVDENGNELAPGKNGTYHYGDSFDVTG
ncbi:MucBP domain-containing protein, partial [Limosilactobacillus mucosae]|uniref:MucBP domain-containing protein n=1 Tax=Limosilactobacillus mucosae TaxID=97478 RepID=UPI003994116C